MKLVACTEAVSLWQSAQLQTKEPTKAGPCVGWMGLLVCISSSRLGFGTYEGELNGAAETGCGCFVVGGPAVGG